MFPGVHAEKLDSLGLDSIANFLYCSYSSQEF